MVQELLQVPGLHYVYSGRTWEWAEQEAYPSEFAHLAFQLGMNYIVYAMMH